MFVGKSVNEGPEAHSLHNSSDCDFSSGVQVPTSVFKKYRVLLELYLLEAKALTLFVDRPLNF